MCINAVLRVASEFGRHAGAPHDDQTPTIKKQNRIGHSQTFGLCLQVFVECKSIWIISYYSDYLFKKKKKIIFVCVVNITQHSQTIGLRPLVFVNFQIFSSVSHCKVYNFIRFTKKKIKNQSQADFEQSKCNINI